MIGLVVAAEVRIYREGLAEALARRDGFAVLAQAASAAEAVGATRTFAPDVLLCDAGLDGVLGAVRTIVDETATRVLALGVGDRVDDVLACAEAGAGGYVTRDASLDELVAAVQAVMRAELVIAPPMAAALLRWAGDRARTASRERERAIRLTSRETEIVALIDAGLSNKQIAARLSIQLSTVKNHVHNILDKLDVTARDDAAAAVRARLRI